MYYWNYKKIGVLLSDEQEMALVRKFANDSTEVVGYKLPFEVRKALKKKISQYLKTLLLNNPEEFERQYYRFSYHDESAQKMFPHILEVFGWNTKKAVFGKYELRHSNEDPFHNLVDSLYGALNKTGTNYYITLMERGLLPWTRYRPHSYISFPEESIKLVEGDISQFFVMTDVLHIRFSSKAIELFISKSE